MAKISYSGYRFPPEIIQQAIWLYVRFTLSFRDVEDLLAERGILVSYETVRRWVNHFGPKIAADLRRRRSKPHTIWHLDEVDLKIDGRFWSLLARRRCRGRSARCAGPDQEEQAGGARNVTMPVGNLAAFLVGDGAAALTGNVEYIDAGYHIVG